MCSEKRVNVQNMFNCAVSYLVLAGEFWVEVEHFRQVFHFGTPFVKVKLISIRLANELKFWSWAVETCLLHDRFWIGICSVHKSFGQLILCLCNKKNTLRKEAQNKTYFTEIDRKPEKLIMWVHWVYRIMGNMKEQVLPVNFIKQI